jgi:hypothetical protein
MAFISDDQMKESHEAFMAKHKLAGSGQWGEAQHCIWLASEMLGKALGIALTPEQKIHAIALFKQHGAGCNHSGWKQWRWPELKKRGGKPSAEEAAKALAASYGIELPEPPEAPKAPEAP